MNNGLWLQIGCEAQNVKVLPLWLRMMDYCDAVFVAVSTYYDGIVINDVVGIACVGGTFN